MQGVLESLVQDSASIQSAIDALGKDLGMQAIARPLAHFLAVPSPILRQEEAT